MRLVAALGVLLGLLVVQGAACLDRVDAPFGHDLMPAVAIAAVMSGDASMARGQAATGTDALVEGQRGESSVGPVSAGEYLASTTPLGAPLGVVGLCIALLTVVLLVVAGLDGTNRLIAVLVRPRTRCPAVQRCHPSPGLAVLCVLRV
ncbi:hypothetical protein SAMN04488074_12894 [Lentzea albidocapillata subsp. violacea]|uniref:Uncharacterized protein n=1 Tax=Lentzea albidocapillata subsp. violacea TaxID=128104 RepID=A0A1G9WVN1_9PSEU|nr:hypothetical protein SAMN04488074_12894 [Lentzea albidocapillata subsp. violacea]